MSYNLKLEQMYDQMAPGWDRSNEPPVTYRIYADEDTDRLGQLTLAGQSFKCHLCGADNKWFPEDDRVFICEHEPIDAGRMSFRQISSIPFRMVSHAENVNG